MNRPSHRAEFVHYASNGWLREQLTRWKEEGLGFTSWSWFRDVCEVAEERGLITIDRSGPDDPFWWRMSKLPFAFKEATP